MKILLATTVAILSGIALAQTPPPCLPGGVCCINGTCGTLEQFKRNATIVCLQADAIENKGLPQAIELAGRCTAAQIMASRVEATQKSNAEEHNRAVEAQRKLREMGVPPESTIQPQENIAIQNALKITNEAANECRAKRLRGELNSYVASVDCATPKMWLAFKAAQYRYMDLILWWVAKRHEVAEKLDRHELTETQAQSENEKIYKELVATERQRDKAVAR